jgi:hypothetical protein
MVPQKDEKIMIQVLSLLAIFMTASMPAYACSVCFGDPNSLQSKALGASVLFLLAVIGGVLVGIGYTIFACSRRAKKLAELNPSSLPSA